MTRLRRSPQPTDLVLDALEMEIRQCTREGNFLQGPVHHFDAGLSMHLYPLHRAACGGNATAESITGPLKTEQVHSKARWGGLEAFKIATLEWIDWFNDRRLLESIGNIPPVEAEGDLLPYKPAICEPSDGTTEPLLNQSDSR